jgi:hypothetical protein
MKLPSLISAVSTKGEANAWIRICPVGAIPSRSAVFFQFGSRDASSEAPDDRNVGNRSKLERTVTLKHDERGEPGDVLRKNRASHRVLQQTG